MGELEDGSWRGRRAFVIGGGPSLRHFDFSLLDDELTLGVNMAFLHGPDVNLVGDLRLMRRLDSDSRWNAYLGHKLWLNSELKPGAETFEGVREVKEHLNYERMPRWSRSLENGLWRRTNAGASALNLAEILGADPIYLLGFDLSGTNWHDEYEADWAPSQAAMETYKDDFTANAGGINAIVVNLNPDSNLRCFPFGDVAKVLDVPAKKG